MVCHVAHGGELATGHFQFGEILLGGMNENETMNGWQDFLFVILLRLAFIDATKGQEILYIEAVEPFFEFECTFVSSVGDAHGKPVEFVPFHHFIERIKEGHCQKVSLAASERKPSVCNTIACTDIQQHSRVVLFGKFKLIFTKLLNQWECKYHATH